MSTTTESSESMVMFRLRPAPGRHLDPSAPRLRVTEYTLVAPAFHTRDYVSPQVGECASEVFFTAAAADGPLTVAELAELARVPVASALVIVADLIQDRLLTPHSPVTARTLGPLERIRELLAGGRRTVDTDKIVLVCPDPAGSQEMRWLLGHVGEAHPHTAGDTAVVHAQRRFTDDLQLSVTGVHGTEPLQNLWPDISRNARAGLLLVTDQDLEQGRACAALLSEHPELPMLVVVHLAGDGELDAPQVHTALDLVEEVPVVMVDAADPSSLYAVVSDLCHHLNRGGGR